MLAGDRHGFEWWISADQRSVSRGSYFARGLERGIQRDWNSAGQIQIRSGTSTAPCAADAPLLWPNIALLPTAAEPDALDGIIAVIGLRLRGRAIHPQLFHGVVTVVGGGDGALGAQGFHRVIAVVAGRC